MSTVVSVSQRYKNPSEGFTLIQNRHHQYPIDNCSRHYTAEQIPNNNHSLTLLQLQFIF
jgi:hypothetical protein